MKRRLAAALLFGGLWLAVAVLVTSDGQGSPVPLRDGKDKGEVDAREFIRVLSAEICPRGLDCGAYCSLDITS